MTQKNLLPLTAFLLACGASQQDVHSLQDDNASTGQAAATDHGPEQVAAEAYFAAWDCFEGIRWLEGCCPPRMPSVDQTVEAGQRLAKTLEVTRRAEEALSGCGRPDLALLLKTAEKAASGPYPTKEQLEASMDAARAKAADPAHVEVAVSDAIKAAFAPVYEGSHTLLETSEEVAMEVAEQGCTAPAACLHATLRVFKGLAAIARTARGDCQAEEESSYQEVFYRRDVTKALSGLVATAQRLSTAPLASAEARTEEILPLLDPFFYAGDWVAPALLMELETAAEALITAQTQLDQNRWAQRLLGHAQAVGSQLDDASTPQSPFCSSWQQAAELRDAWRQSPAAGHAAMGRVTSDFLREDMAATSVIGEGVEQARSTCNLGWAPIAAPD